VSLALYYTAFMGTPD